jgi:hypothetical protein
MSDLPEGVKDIVKELSGNERGVEWSIIAYLTDDGQYYCYAHAGELKIETKRADDLDTAIGFGAACMVEFFEMLGVSHAP